MMAPASDHAARGELGREVALARLTTWRVGGPAERLYRPADAADLVLYLASLPADEPLLWLGLGSNLLVRDGGLRGTVIALHGKLTGLAQTGPTGVRAEAGVPCAKLARFTGGCGLTGAEFMAGIPGTVGGALAMNAGAFGGETWERVVAVETVDRGGGWHRRQAAHYRVGYRNVEGPAEEWFLAAHFELAPGEREHTLDRIRALLAQREASQPLGVASCGSVFRNPPGDYAARLIETAGLKGHRIGGARVAERHANFIFNTGAATAADIEALIEHVQAAVEAVHGVRLVPEVRIVGDSK